MKIESTNNQKRLKIVHDFAKWTAQSALRSASPIKAGKEIYSLIENHANLAVLFEAAPAISRKEFDNWHQDTILTFCGIEPKLKTLVGWAAKIINVYLKTRVYLACEGREGLVSAIHPPLDNGIQRGLNKRFPDRPWKTITISNVRSYRDDYLPFVEHCRSLSEFDGCLPIELEFYWLGAE